MSVISNNYLVINERAAYEQIKNTAANNTINGFYYQFLVTVSKWLDLYNEYKNKNESYRLYCEFEDDIKIEEKSSIKYIQVKANGSPVTNSRDSLKKTIYNFFLLYYYNKNTNREIEFILESNSYLGQNAKLIKNWSLKNLSKEDRIDLIASLKESIEPKLKEKNYKLPTDIDFNNFIDLISFNLKNQSIDKCNFEEKNLILKKIKNSDIEIDGGILLPRLLQEVIDKSSSKGKDNRVLDNKCLLDILKEGEDIIIKNTDDKYKEILKDIDDKLEFINKNTNETNIDVKCIKDNTYKIIEKMDNSNAISEENKKLINDIVLNGRRILVRSRAEIDESETQLSLLEFFVKGNPKKAYQNIINKDFWNKEIIYKINKFFDNIIKNKEKFEYVLMDLDSTHTSVAFYIGYMYYKAFTRKVFMVRSEKLFIKTSTQVEDNKLLKESVEILQGDDIAVIVNTTVSVSNSFNDIKNFIVNSRIPVKVINNYFTEKIGKDSITGENIRDLASELYLEFEKLKGKIHLFLICPNELAFLIGRELDKKSNIILYEYTNYCGDENKEPEKLYVETIDTKKINSYWEEEII